MKSFREYLNESEETFDRPTVGDNFAINIREETLLETYIVDEIEDGIVLHADEKTMTFLESYGYLGEALSESQDFEIDSDEDGDDIEVTDQGEYDQEGDMAKDDLATIVRAAKRLTGMLDDNENMPEWVQSKINKAADYVDTAADYIESNKTQGVAEGEDDLVDLGPALRNLTGEFNKFMKHDDRMKTDPAYAKKWNKRYAKYAGNNDHSIYDDPDDDKEQGIAEGFDEIQNLKNKIKKLEKQAEYYSFEPGEVDPKSGHSYRPNFVRTIKQIRELKNQLKQLQSKQGVSEGSADQWYVVPRSSLDYNGNYYGKVNDVSGPFSKVQAKAELHKAHPYDTNWTIVPAVALMNKGVAEGQLDEAKYQGREVPLGKPMAGDVAKSKVYVRDPKTGNVKKVNFGDPNMRIKKSDPDRRRSFRARHNCDNPGSRLKARYWSCRAW